MSYTCADIVKRCEEKGAVKFRDGKERNGWVKINGVNATRVTVPKGRSEVTKGTLGSIKRQLLLDANELSRFLDCPMTKAEYLKLVAKRKGLSPKKNK